MKKDLIFIDENIALLPQMLENCASVNTFSGRKLSNSDLMTSNCNILISRSQTKINEELLSGTKVRFAATATSGIDHVDLDYLKKENIVFANASGANANSVAEYVVYAILKWSFINSLDLKGKTLGIIGYGNIGKIVARYGSWLGLKVLVNDPPLKDNEFAFPDSIDYVELSELCAFSDVITNHVPLSLNGQYPTKYLLNQKLIDSIRKNSLFIHSSRGGVVEESAILERTSKNEIKIAIDVWENEPFFDVKLAEMSMLCSPHIAGYSRDGKLKGTLIMAEQYSIFSGNTPDYSLLNRELELYKPISKDYFSNYKYIMETIENNRQFEYDTRFFKELFILDNKERAIEFDLQRKNYPIRRETL